MSYPAYRTVHYWLERNYGKASSHTCVDCNGNAGQWSYNGGDPSELTSKAGMPYSTDLTRYSPRCVRCHKRHDGHRGETHYETTKTDAEVQAIIAEYVAGGISQTALGLKHGVSQPTISEWVRGVKRMRHDH